jgi:hypothetical protein
VKIYTNNPGGRGAVIECTLQELEAMRRGLYRVCSEEMDKTGGPFSMAPHTVRYCVASKMVDAVSDYLINCDRSREEKRARKKKKVKR